jgi:hypothetical protein
MVALKRQEKTEKFFSPIMPHPKIYEELVPVSR